MATEQTTIATPDDSLGTWTSWIAALAGAWVLASPFVLTGEFGGGTAIWSNAFAGLAVLAFAGYGARALRSAPDAAAWSPGEVAGWLAALVGAWIVVAPFALGGTVASGAPLYANVAAGALALVLAGYAGWANRAAA